MIRPQQFCLRCTRSLTYAVFALLGLVSAVCYTSRPAWATDSTWTANSDGFWTTNGNWFPLAAPDSATAQVQIDDGDSSVTVTMDANITIGGLTLGSNDTLLIKSQFVPVSLTSAGGFTSDGTIRLEGSSTSTERLSINSGALTNSATGVLHFADGSGNPFFDGDLVNNGTVTVDHDALFDKFAGSYANNAQFGVAAGRTLTVGATGAFNQNGGTLDLDGTLNVTAGTFTQNSGTLDAGANAMIEGGSVSYLGGTISGTLQLKNTTLTLGPGTGSASFLMKDNNSLASDVRAGQTITVESGFSAVTLASGSGFTNHGTIRLQGTSVQVQRLSVSAGTLTNSATGLIRFQAGPGAPRFDGDLINNGTVTVDKDTTFDKFSGSYTNNNQLTVPSNVTLSIAASGVLNQNVGTFDLDGTLVVSGGALTLNGGALDLGANALIDGGNVNYLGGTINGTLRLKDTTLTLGPGTNPASFLMKDNNNLASDVRAGQTITVESGTSAVTLASGIGFTNHGTIQLQGTSVQIQRLSVSAGTLTNSATGLIHFQAGPGAPRFDGDLINNGTVTVDKDTTFDKFSGSYTNNNQLTVPSNVTLSIAASGVLNQNVGTFDLDGTLVVSGGALTLNGGTLDVGPGAVIDSSAFNYLGGTINGTPQLRNAVLTLGPGTNPASFLIKEGNNLASDIRAGQSLTVESSTGSVTLAANSGFTNHGSLLLTATQSNTTRLSVNIGALTNSPTGLIHFQPGSGTRAFDGDLINNGTLLVSHDTVFDKFNGSYTNNSLIKITGGATLTIGSSGTLTNFSTGGLTGGVYDIEGIFKFPGAGISDNHADLTLRGAGAHIVDSNDNSSALVLFTHNAATGKFRLKDNAQFSTFLTYTNDGLIELANSEINVPALTNSATGTIIGSGSIVAAVFNSGVISPGASPGILEINGSYDQTAAGKLQISIHGNDNSDPQNLEYDVLKINSGSTTDLAGMLEVSLHGFTPAASDLFTILDAVTLNGTFGNVANGQRLASVGGEGSFLVTYNGATGNVTLSGFARPGDFDSDGDVDGADFVAWQTHFPTANGATLADGDADGDGDVDGADFVVWQTNFPFTPGPAAAPVPEPAGWSLALAAFGLLGFLSRSAVRQ